MAEGTQLPKVHRNDKVVNPSLKPETNVKREGIPKPMPVIPESVSEPKMITPPCIEKDREEQVV